MTVQNNKADPQNNKADAQNNKADAQNNKRVQNFINNPKKAVWTLAIPVILGMSIGIIYNFADMYFVSGLGPEAVAAITFSAPLFMLAIALSWGLSVGATALIARFIGAKKKELADNTAEHALLLSVILGALITIIGYVYRDRIFVLLGAEGLTLQLAIDYFGVVIFSSIFLFITAFSNSILSGEGNTKTPMIIQAAASLLNIILDPIFIYVLRYGISGAAIATVFSQIFAFALMMGFLFVKRGSYVSLKPRHFRFNPALFIEMLKIGVPSSITHIFISFGMIFENFMVSYFGTGSVAAFGIASRYVMFVFLPLIGISMAVITLVGMFKGAKRSDLIIDVSKYAIRVSILIAVLIGVSTFILAEVMMRVFTDDLGLIEIGTTYLRYIVFVFPIIAVTLNTGRFMQGLGTGVPSLVIISSRVFFVFMPVAFLFTRVLNYGLTSVWVAMILSSVVAVIIALFYLRSTYKKLSSQGS